MMKQQFFSPPHFILILSSWLLSSVEVLNVHAFTPTLPYSPLNNRYNKLNCQRANQLRKYHINLNLSAKSKSSSLPKASEMKASELRKELQSYGISTKSFFEKSELVDAVEKARADGKTPITDDEDSGEEKTSSDSTTSTDSSSSRQERLVEEMDKCNKMKVGELKKELQSLGISTKSFFEKSEFVRALAEARVDGVKKSESSTQSREEEYDPSYRDVQMQKMDARMLGMSPVIDVRLGK